MILAPSPTLDDLWQGKARFVIEQQNGAPRTFGFQGLHFLSFVQVKGGWNVYYIDHDPQNNGVGLAFTHDGITFQKVARVLERGRPGEFDQRIASFPGAYKDGSNWYLVYEAADGLENDHTTWRNRGNIALATSKDGRNWTKQGPIFDKKEPWERQNVGTPSLLKTGKTWWLFYHGFGQSLGQDDVQIGAAKGPSLRDLVRVKPTPILPTSPDPQAFDSGTVGKRTLIREGRWWYMAYEASGDQAGNPPGFNNAPWTTGLARSRDLVNWEKFPRPILPILPEFGNDGPEFLRTHDGRLHLYFRLPGNWTGRATLTHM